MSKTAIFLDRDDTLIVDKPYLNDPAGLEFTPTAVAAVRRLNAAGIPAILITNQSGLARGLISTEQLEAVHARLNELLAAGGAHLDAIYFCPHHKDGKIAELAIECACRKPAPGMLLQAAADFDLKLERCSLVGDKADDMAAIHSVGGRAVQVGTRAGLEPDYRASDLLDAINWIIEDITCLKY